MVLLFGATCFACQGHHFKDKSNRAKNKGKRQFFTMGVLRYFSTEVSDWNDSRFANCIRYLFFEAEDSPTVSYIFYICI